jgi:hypothetical protein
MLKFPQRADKDVSPKPIEVCVLGALKRAITPGYRRSVRSMRLVQQPYVESLDRGQTDEVWEQWQPQFLGKRLLFHVRSAVTV